MKHTPNLLIMLSLLLGLSVAAQAQAPTAHLIAVKQPWARATPVGAKTGATYMAIINNGESPDTLLGATTPVATQVQFHRVTEEHGISRMRELKTLDLAPGAEVILKPGGMHVMLVGLKQPLKEGGTFPLTLRFERAGRIDIKVSVARVGATEHGTGPTKQ